MGRLVVCMIHKLMNSQTGLTNSSALPRSMHRTSASVPAYLVPSPHIHYRHLSQGIPRMDSLMESPISTSHYSHVNSPSGYVPRPRSNSIDSGHVSIADSLTRLIPSSHPQSPIHQLGHGARPIVTTDFGNLGLQEVDISAKNDLTSEEKLVLIKRIRKLEDKLGAIVREDAHGQWVIDERGSNGIKSKDAGQYNKEHSVR